MTAIGYYQNISELPLCKFIECLTKNNIHALVITGDPSREDLEDAWASILMEYRDEMRDGEDKFHFGLLKETELLRLDYVKVGVCVQILETEIANDWVPRDRRFADDLNALVNERFKFDHNDPDQFRKDLKRAVIRSKAILIKYQMKKAQLEGINGVDNSKIETPDAKYFQSILNTLSLYSKFQLTDSMSVYSFCDWVKKYNEYSKVLESQNKK